MKKIILLAILSISFLIYSCEKSDNPTIPKEGCNDDLNPSLLALYDCGPDAASCNEGELKMSEKLKAMDRLNYFRNIHGLPLVTYNTEFDDDVQKSALISVANKTLNHYPLTTYKCYTTAGDTACQRSNLHLSWSSGFSSPWNSAMSIDGWISEKYSTSIGHRRWFLNPFLKTVSFGRVDNIASTGEYVVGTTMYIWDASGATTSNVEFIACPFHDYPSTAFETGLIMSFTAIYNKSASYMNNAVNYSSATIQVIDESNTSYSVYNVSSDNIGYGVPNNIEWKTNDLSYNKKYTVKINNVIVNGTNKNYEYWFKLTK